MDEGEAPTAGTGLRKTYKYKLKPTKAQVATFARWLDLCRALYNAALEERKLAWQRRHVALDRRAQLAELPDLKRELPEYQEVYAQVLQEAVDRVDRLFKEYFRRLRAGRKPGYPRYRGWRRYNGFTFPQFTGGIRLDPQGVTLPKIGHVRVFWSRPIEGCIKTITICREADGWYVCFSCADVPAQPLPKTGKETGIDLGLETFATLSDGSTIPNPRVFDVALMAIKRAHRRVDRRKRGSRRREKAVQLVRKAYLKVRRQREDFRKKTALALVREYDAIYYEHLNLANMMRNRHLSRQIRDASWGGFCFTLSYKAAWAGKRAVAVSPRYTSQACSGCGVMVTKGLSVRWHSCPECGTELHRDHNAALNILRLGQESAAGQAAQAPTQAVTPYVA